ncbi:hypothetical protein Bca101_023495 [Brassica carinata]
MQGRFTMKGTELQTLTTAELNGYVIKPQPIRQLTVVQTDNGWCYIPFSKCSKKLQRGVSSCIAYADNGWCYVACSKCSRKLQRTVSTFTCARCANSHAVGALRYRVEMAIAEDTAEGTFVWFDGVMTKLHNLRASDAAQMLVRVTAYNFTEYHWTFTVTRIVDEIVRQPEPDVADNGDDDDGVTTSQFLLWCDDKPVFVI